MNRRKATKGKGLTRGMERGPAAMRAQTIATIAGGVLPHLAAEICRQRHANGPEGPGGGFPTESAVCTSTVKVAFDFGEAYVDELNRRAIDAWTEDEGKPKVSGNGAATETQKENP